MLRAFTSVWAPGGLAKFRPTWLVNLECCHECESSCGRRAAQLSEARAELRTNHVGHETPGHLADRRNKLRHVYRVSGRARRTGPFGPKCFYFLGADSAGNYPDVIFLVLTQEKILTPGATVYLSPQFAGCIVLARAAIPSSPITRSLRGSL